ncbi:MAG: transposase [Phycisphaerae bacterium]
MGKRSSTIDEARQPYRKRCRRRNVPGDAHYLTFSCLKRRPFLTSERACGWFIESLKDAREKHEFDVWAYVLMPEHVHLLIWPTRPAYSISDILGDVKQPVTRATLKFVRKHAPEFLARMRDARPNGKSSHRFWQRGGGYDRNLNTPRSITEKINYIHENPVRRGLVAVPTDYRWSSAAFYAGKTDVDLVPDVDSVPDMVIVGGRACPR